jgi:hypothetical protein
VLLLVQYLPGRAATHSLILSNHCPFLQTAQGAVSELACARVS